jgi:thiol-disulfide isomerase/thioredoxin
MITRRFLIFAGGAASLSPPALAKEDHLPLPPALGDLSTLALTRPDGADTTLGAELTPGRAGVISLWATWCGPCIQEAQHLSKIRTANAPDALDIIGINVERNRDEKKIASFVKKGRVNYAQLRGDPELTYTAFGGLMPITLPRLYVFDRAGRATKAFGRYSGGKTLKEIDAAVAAATRG